jgi:O-antigen ligase
VLLAGLLVLVFALGGGSRHDIESLAWLRPLVFLAAAVGVLGLDRDKLRAYWLPFTLLAALAALMAVQLVPLPPSLWTQLPGREGIARLDVALGLADLWRPLTISPVKTWNSLASLIVPFAVLVLYCQLTERRQRDILVVLVVLAVVGACFGFLQLLAGTDSGLYLYSVTQKDAAVGLFANRNHHTVFMAAAMLIALHLALASGRPARGLLPVLCLAAAAVLVIAVVGNVSRGGLLSLGVALVLVPLVIVGRGEGGARTWLKAAGLALPVLGVFLLFAFSQRSPALARLLTDSATDDARARILPSLIEMARAHQPFGTGFGAFEYAYRIDEPAGLVVRNYFNNAHNDWLQVAIEGGVAGTLLLAAVLFAIAVRAVRLARFRSARGEPSLARAWLGFSVLAVLGFASLFDYPLRVPSIMAVATIALAMFNGPVLEQLRRKGCETPELT